MKTVVSFGGGVNSTALLVGLHERHEHVDAILFADTGGEKPGTYEHIERMQDWLKLQQMPPVTIVRQKLTLEQDCANRETLPSKAFGFGTCSERFKIQPQRTWAKEHGPVAAWLVGIHAEETRRAKRIENDQGEPIRYPLIEWGWGQQQCVAAILRAGLIMPVKSACFFCPAMRKAEVLQLGEDHPDLLDRAIAMEDAAIESGNLTTVSGLGRRWRWGALVKADSEQLKLFPDDQSPLCDVCIDQ